MKLVLGFCLAMVLGACAPGGSDSKSNQIETKEKTINGQSLSEYYKQFVAYTTGVCHGSPEKEYHYIHTFNAAAVGKLKDADVKLDLNIFMRANGEYTAYYELQKVSRYFDGGYAYDVLEKNIINGQWVVNDDMSMTLTKLGKATGVTYNGKEALYLNLTGSIGGFSLDEKHGLLTKGYSGVAPYGEKDECL